MAKTHFTSVPDYIASQPKEVQTLLKRIRTTIRKAVPKAKETISYNIPAYTMDGSTVVYFAGWKKHFSLYPANARLVAAFKKELAPYEVNNKGTIRFPISEPPPMTLIAAIARFRAKDVTENLEA
jgi:uncharacterized protein YdhG (YjbR/CyaY superfamily)